MELDIMKIKPLSLTPILCFAVGIGGGLVFIQYFNPQFFQSTDFLKLLLYAGGISGPIFIINLLPSMVVYSLFKRPGNTDNMTILYGYYLGNILSVMVIYICLYYTTKNQYSIKETIYQCLFIESIIFSVSLIYSYGTQALRLKRQNDAAEKMLNEKIMAADQSTSQE
jgi:hypothetical protein